MCSQQKAAEVRIQRGDASWPLYLFESKEVNTIAENEKEAAAAMELASYALLRTKAPRRNLSCTPTEVGKPSVRGERGAPCRQPLAGRTPRSWPSLPSRPAQKLREDSKKIRYGGY
ncbi:hypothetical protein GQ55_7G287900 [Panicum hallii var. hallii]|uniref:Uncharacterized protein n=1 Tax=Panicum hallii var. hallii TaxID=1504633 RepID=A0A2T7D044_9POAL|nr:hypothetical protein GQ55_7G287900 [Panicum hallii var. hallii]